MSYYVRTIAEILGRRQTKPNHWIWSMRWDWFNLVWRLPSISKIPYPTSPEGDEKNYGVVLSFYWGPVCHTISLYGFDFREMQWWYGFILRRCKDGMVLTLGRCQDGMVLILGRCWYCLVLFLGRSKDDMILILGRRWNSLVLSLGRCKHGMVFILGRCWDGMTREKLC